MIEDSSGGATGGLSLPTSMNQRIVGASGGRPQSGYINFSNYNLYCVIMEKGRPPYAPTH